ncbi:cyclin D2, partial [Trifolium medium]|nr:cyclin D2 [Trifolium medium]
MAPPSFDFASLFCQEDSSIFDENDFGGPNSFEMLDESWQDECDPYLNQIPQFDDSTQQFNEPIALVPPPLLSDESLKDLVAKECHHLPASDYVNRLKYGDLDLQDRMEAVDWIEKVGVHFGFGPLCLYLAVSFMDRFLSVVEMLKERTWSIQLLAVGCLYLAAKIDETVVPRTVDMQ